ncbi:unnamed protein product [Clavelina lepadiformis]|uniref:Uncharacterized protein n=1 Tax=Clavelina lepadiformis TaxID=159417 RepID=A0ABP0EUX6_CLALP
MRRSTEQEQESLIPCLLNGITTVAPQGIEHGDTGNIYASVRTTDVSLDYFIEVLNQKNILAICEEIIKVMFRPSSNSVSAGWIVWCLKNLGLVALRAERLI